MNTLSADGSRASRKAHIEFQKDIAPFRGDLFRFCRSLTGNPWDAEDLVQETLLKVFGRLADAHAGIDSPKSYLFKTASNHWIDWCRRAKLPIDSATIPDLPYSMGPMVEVRGALTLALQYLPPKERLALVLKDTFDFTLEEIADISQSTVNAVKAALHRARTKMESLAGRSFVHDQTFVKANRDLIEKVVVAFNARDIDAISRLFLASATGNAPGCFLESNLEEIKRGSLFYTINSPDGQPRPATLRAQCVDVGGEPLFVIWDGENIDDVWKFTFEDGQLAGFDCYYCCPEVLDEIAMLLGAISNFHGYYFEQGNGE
jgi:RNA polymerase sigma-70 factor (ECF subfamily)